VNECSYSSIGQDVRSPERLNADSNEIVAGAVHTLYVVATPIGNLGDLSPRAVHILREVSLIAAEDTRHSRRLLTHFNIATPLVSYHQHNQRARHDMLMAALEGGDVALITDAGTPGISDPGSGLVAAALAAGYRVSPVPGPSSLAAAVSVSGLGEGPFVFLGFLPRPADERRLVVARAAATGFPLVLMESAQRLQARLSELSAVLGNRATVMARELTKVHEEVRLTTLGELRDDVARDPLRGEIVLVISGAQSPLTSETELDDVLRTLRRAGLSISQTAREAAQMTGRPRSELYMLATKLERESSVGLERQLATPDEDALQDALGDQERPERREP
jgi:16S rRNA (cytidine1402-2'-O)-methyltransferase